MREERNHEDTHNTVTHIKGHAHTNTHTHTPKKVADQALVEPVVLALHFVDQDGGRHPVALSLSVISRK